MTHKIRKFILEGFSFRHRAGQDNREAAAFAGFGPKFDSSPKFLYDALADGKPQPCSLREFVVFIEARENHFLLIRFDAAAGIFHPYPHFALVNVISATQLDISLFGEFARVVQEVGHDLGQSFLVRIYLDVFNAFILFDKLYMRRHQHLMGIIDVVQQVSDTVFLNGEGHVARTNAG